DLALNFVVREAHLLEVARCLPTTKAALQQVPGLTSQEVRINGQAMLDIVLGVDALPEEAYPPNVERLVDFPGYKKTVTAVREVCMNVAQEMAIPVELIGSKKQVEQLLKWCWFSLDETRAQQLQPDLLGGWREPLLRQKLAQIDSLKLPSDEK
ncbi:MAG: ribonuclease D, partial [Paraglaciecola sp.]